MREIGGLLLLALAVLLMARAGWKLYGPRKRVHGMKIRLPGDED